MTTAVLSQRIEKNWFTEALLIVGTSLIITLFGHISFLLPFTPIPVSTQASFCLFLGIFLGSRRAALAVLLFLIEGAMGLPVFSLGKSGFWHLMGPTGGYLFGTVLGTYLAGRLFESGKTKTASKAFMAMAAGNAVIFLCGYCQLTLFLGFKSAFMLGVLPFLLGDLFKLLISAKCIKFIKDHS